MSDLKKEWIVANEDGEVSDFCGSRKNAEELAEMMATENPGEIHIVYESVCYFNAGKAVKHGYSK